MPMAAINPVWISLLFNLLPVVSAAAFGWSVLPLMLLYWFENVVLGVINGIKMLIEGLSSHNLVSGGSLLFILPFYTFHYGMFVAVHGIFLFILFANDGAIGDNFAIAELPHRVFAVLAATPFGWLNLLMLVTFHVGYFFVDWIGNKRWRGVQPAVQMFAPYGRVAVIHVTIIFGAFLVLVLHQPLLAVLLLALLKTALEVGWVKIMAVREARLAREHHPAAAQT